MVMPMARDGPGGGEEGSSLRGWRYRRDAIIREGSLRKRGESDGARWRMTAVEEVDVDAGVDVKVEDKVEVKTEAKRRTKVV